MVETLTFVQCLLMRASLFLGDLGYLSFLFCDVHRHVGLLVILLYYTMTLLQYSGTSIYVSLDFRARYGDTRSDGVNAVLETIPSRTGLYHAYLQYVCEYVR